MIPAIILLVIAAVYRIVTGFIAADNSWLPNFAPLAALALCAPSVLPRRLAFALPLAVLFVSDTVLNVHYGFPLFTFETAARFVPIALITLVGVSMSGSRSLAGFGLASLASSTGFYLVTNSVSWLTDPGYAKNAAGWLQAMTTGLPGYIPTWMFFRNTLASDLVFTALFVACLAFTAKKATVEPVMAAAKA